MSAGNLGGEEVVATRRWQPNGPGGVADLRPDPRFTGASELTSSAYAFARDAHAGQRHEADGSPYIEHPVAVGQVAVVFSFRAGRVASVRAFRDVAAARAALSS
jgi:(p)ppGpp synthase/HD superfamily hydrolase